MEHMDPNVEAQVWQRVLAQPEKPEQMDLRALQVMAMEQAAAYRHLAAVLSGRDRERTRALYEEQLVDLACLKGLYVLSGGAGEQPKMLGTPREPAEKLLRRCYYRARRAVVEYTSRSGDGEFGEVFRHLAKRAGVHCARIAELLGGLK